MRAYPWFCFLFLLTACDKSGPNMQMILADKPAPSLADYNLFTDMHADTPSDRVFAYDLVNPLFTDYATKRRYVYVPKGQSAQYNATDALDFPVGTVLIKTFGYAPDMRTPNINSYKVETRLLIHKKDGWLAAPYVWNEAQTEAKYAPIGKRLHIQTVAPAGNKLDFSYAVPNANQCKTCHQSGHDVLPIGPKARNLNHNDQLQNWQTQGLLSGLVENLPKVPETHNTSFPLNVRARAYLDINCAHCHKPDGSASNSGLMLEWGETDQTRLGVGKRPTAAGRGAGGLLTVITPGKPDTSILAFRMQSAEPGIDMPELGRTLVHDEGVALIREWITEMPIEDK